eukprot:TRINITY_DN9375_c0_g1_i1.p1 TRINITY_DN9375_c0_g1~~TRINITY_DN9375_c0_g1_i1.p1  ORF type:complete len:140 (-),score=27.75 TRINITY_DN9375_c0_g1_i1:60-479(-)
MCIRDSNFLQEISDLLDVEENDSALVAAVEACAKSVFGKSWHSKLGEVAVQELGNHRKYRYSSVRDLLRVIRNKAHHWRSLPTGLSELMGPMPEGFVKYFVDRFPKLVISMFWVFKDGGMHAEPALQGFYNGVQNASAR